MPYAYRQGTLPFVANAKSETEEAPKVEKSSEVAFTHDVHIRDAGVITGHAPYVVAGALAGVSKKELTATEVNSAVSKFLKAEVATAEHEGEDEE